MPDNISTKIRKCTGIKASLSKEKCVHKNVLNTFATVAVFTIIQHYRRSQTHHSVKKGFLFMKLKTDNADLNSAPDLFFLFSWTPQHSVKD